MLIEKNGQEEKDDDVIYIDRVCDIGTIKSEYVYEFIEVKKIFRVLFSKVEEALEVERVNDVKSVEENDNIIKSF